MIPRLTAAIALGGRKWNGRTDMDWHGLTWTGSNLNLGLQQVASTYVRWCAYGLLAGQYLLAKTSRMVDLASGNKHVASSSERHARPCPNGWVATYALPRFLSQKCVVDLTSKCKVAVICLLPSAVNLCKDQSPNKRPRGSQQSVRRLKINGSFERSAGEAPACEGSNQRERTVNYCKQKEALTPLDLDSCVEEIERTSQTKSKRLPRSKSSTPMRPLSAQWVGSLCLWCPSCQFMTCSGSRIAAAWHWKLGKGGSVTRDTLIAKWQAFNILSNELYTLQTEMRLNCLKREGMLSRLRSRRSTAVSTKVLKARNSYQRYSEILREL